MCSTNIVTFMVKTLVLDAALQNKLRCDQKLDEIIDNIWKTSQVILVKNIKKDY